MCSCLKHSTDSDILVSVVAVLVKQEVVDLTYDDDEQDSRRIEKKPTSPQQRAIPVRADSRTVKTVEKIKVCSTELHVPRGNPTLYRCFLISEKQVSGGHGSSDAARN